MMREHALWLGGGIAAVLILASTVSVILKSRVARGQPHAEIDNLNARIASWWTIAAIVGAAAWAGTQAVCALFAVVSLQSLREFIAKPATVYTPRRWITGVFICVICMAHIPALMWLDIPLYGGHNGLLLMYFLLVAQASDVLQYLWGKWLGRRLIAPAISPSKTVEGFMGGITCATLLGTGLWWLTPFSVLGAAVVSLVITLLGFASGLVLSAEKRARGIKDWGSLIPGHGGMLDRVDSLWLAAPVFYYWVRAVYA